MLMPPKRLRGMRRKKLLLNRKNRGSIRAFFDSEKVNEPIDGFKASGGRVFVFVLWLIKKFLDSHGGLTGIFATKKK